MISKVLAHWTLTVVFLMYQFRKFISPLLFVDWPRRSQILPTVGADKGFLEPLEDALSMEDVTALELLLTFARLEIFQADGALAFAWTVDSCIFAVHLLFEVILAQLHCPVVTREAVIIFDLNVAKSLEDCGLFSLHASFDLSTAHSYSDHVLPQ